MISARKDSLREVQMNPVDLGEAGLHEQPAHGDSERVDQARFEDDGGGQHSARPPNRDPEVADTVEVSLVKEPLEELFYATLNDVYHIQGKHLEGLAKIADLASAPSLKEAIEEIRAETRIHIERLDQVFETIGRRPVLGGGEFIDCMSKEAAMLPSTTESARDPAIILVVQTAGHYKMARYGTLAAWAKQLGHGDSVELLEATLEEEKDADKKLSGLAEACINARVVA